MKYEERKSISFIVMGDSLINKAEVRFINQEVTLHDFEDYGFNLLTCPNNHTLDYSKDGLFTTKEHLNQHDFIHAGAEKKSDYLEELANLIDINARYNLNTESADSLLFGKHN